MNETIPPPARIWQAAGGGREDGRGDPSARPGYITLGDVVPTGEEGRDRGGVRAVTLDPQVERPQPAQDEEAVERPGHARPSRSGGTAAAPRPRRREVAATPTIVSEWPARYFVAEWKTMSAPKLERPLEGRRGERVVDDDERPRGRSRPPARATAATVAAMSTTLSSGFDGRLEPDEAGPLGQRLPEHVRPGREVDVARVDARAAGGPARGSGTSRRRRRRRRRSRRRGRRAGRSPRSPPSPTRTRSRGVPPSSAATARSSRSRVGFCERAYS